MSHITLEQYTVDHRISSMDFEKYVLNILNTRLDLPTSVSDSDIDICHPLQKSKKNQLLLNLYAGQ